MQDLSGLTFTALPTVNVDAAGIYVEQDGLGTNDWPRIHGGLTISAGSGGGNITFVRVESNRFDADQNDVTQVDTLNIEVGDTVRWTWTQGVHTVTSGTGAADPQSGVLFDAPSTSADPVFEYVFNNAGTFHYYCIPHEGDNMRGIVVVTPGTSSVTDWRNSSLPQDPAGKILSSLKLGKLFAPEEVASTR